MFELMDSFSQTAVIKVIGVGGGGGNAVSHMAKCGIEGVEFICVNTDAQALKHSQVKTSLQIGCNITKGLGAGANPEVGRQAAMEDRDRIIELIEGCDMLFITAGMGGGTGTGAAPVVAQVARELGILTVAVVTRPFTMEGNKRATIAEMGMTELSRHVDSLITIPNQKLLQVLGGQTTLLEAFKRANEVLQGAVQGIAELITRPGLINVDFADVRTVMSETGPRDDGLRHRHGRAPRARRRRDGRVVAAARGHQPRGRARHPRQRHGGPRPVDRRVRGSRQHRQAVRGRGRDRRGRHRHRARDAGRAARHGRRDRPQPEQAKVAAPAQAAAAAPRVGAAAGRRQAGCAAYRAPAPDYSHLDRPAIHRQPQRAVGDGLRASLAAGGRAGHPGIPPAPGRLRRAVSRDRDEREGLRLVRLRLRARRRAAGRRAERARERDPSGSAP